MMTSYSIGVDFGTNSVRSILVNCNNGEEIANHVYPYPSGEQGILLDSHDHHLARQNPHDYLQGLEITIQGVIQQASKQIHFSKEQVVGIGVGTTGSTPIPVDQQNQPLALSPQWKNHLAAQAWLWKDHTAFQEAVQITQLASEIRPHFLEKCGGTYSSEWFWSKIWKCLHSDPEVFEAAYSWVELADYIPSILVGCTDPRKIVRGVCGAGHKAMYANRWGGLPDKEFLHQLAPPLADLRDRLYEQAHDASQVAGVLCEDWANTLGLHAGIPIAVGALDAHYGAIGSGITEGRLVKIIGTSTCDCIVVPFSKNTPDIEGISGIVDGSILPGYVGIEAGQSAVGDIFKWFVEGVCQGDDQLYFALTEKAEKLSPGESGLLALDWNNGSRNILADPQLSGLLIGQTLHTTRAEIYRALIESTAFGARMIIERIEEYDVRIDQVVCCGGIAEKSPLLMQIYADVTGCTMQMSSSSQTCALGSAIVASVVAGRYPSIEAAQEKMTSLKPTEFHPIPENRAIYHQLFALYQQLHDAFGGVSEKSNIASVMKRLIQIKDKQSMNIKS